MKLKHELGSFLSVEEREGRDRRNEEVFNDERVGNALSLGETEVQGKLKRRSKTNKKKKKTQGFVENKERPALSSYCWVKICKRENTGGEGSKVWGEYLREPFRQTVWGERLT